MNVKNVMVLVKLKNNDIVKLLFFIFTFLPLLLTSQNEIEVLQTDNEICFIDKINPDAEWYQYYVQNSDDLSQYETWWSKSTDTCVVSSYCNNRCHRIAFINSHPMFSNIVETSIVDIKISIGYYYNQLYVTLDGNWDEAKLTLYSIYSKQQSSTVVYIEPSTMYFNIQSNHKNLPRVLVIEYEKGNCKGTLTRLIYY